MPVALYRPMIDRTAPEAGRAPLVASEFVPVLIFCGIGILISAVGIYFNLDMSQAVF